MSGLLPRGSFGIERVLRRSRERGGFGRATARRAVLLGTDRRGAGHVASGRPRMLDERDNRFRTGRGSWKRCRALYRNSRRPSREIDGLLGLEGGRRATLLALVPSAIMRRRRALARSAPWLAVLLAVASGTLAPGLCVAAAPDSLRWLPAPEEDLESLEPLEEAPPDFATGYLARSSL